MDKISSDFLVHKNEIEPKKSLFRPGEVVSRDVSWRTGSDLAGTNAVDEFAGKLDWTYSNRFLPLMNGPDSPGIRVGQENQLKTEY